VKEGGKTKLTFIGREDQPFEGLIESVAWGIFDANGSTVQLLPQVGQTVDWVRLPNRFPVRIRVTGQSPIPLRIGQTVSIATIGE
jgi:multidrug resistance efflux pump